MQSASDLLTHYAALKARLNRQPRRVERAPAQAAAAPEPRSAPRAPIRMRPGDREIYSVPIGPARPLTDGITVHAIVALVAAHTGISRSEIIGPRRFVSLSEARQIACYLARRTLGLSYPGIGAKIGGRDHTTIIHAVQQVERRMAADTVFAARINGLVATLEARR